MGRRARVVVFLLLLSLSFVALTSCGSGSKPALAVALSQTAPQTLTGNGTLTLTATITNDSTTGGGVTWTISPAAGCGTLSATTGASVTYTAPASSALTAPCTATITSTSNSNTAKFASVQVTVNPVSVSIAGGAQSATAGGSTVALSATVTNDPATGGVTWSLSPATGCGTVASSGTSATYTPPAASANAACTATVAATSVSDNTKKSTVMITVTLPPITLSLAPSTAQTVKAGGTMPLTATIGNDFGNKGVAWSVTPATGCGSVSGSGMTATYTAPTVLATACTATVKVTAVGDTNKTASVAATVNPIGVTLAPTSAQTLMAAQSLALTGTLTNDGTNSGLTWSVSPASGCGNLSASTGASVTYTAPLSSSLTTACTATVSAASAADSSKSASVQVTVNPISVAISGSKGLSAIAGGSTLPLAATLTNDPSNSGLTWSLSPASGCGTLSAATGTSVTYTPPAASANAACTATVTVASTADITKKDTATITATLPAITLLLAPSVAQTLQAGSTLPLTATIGNDFANQGVSWSVNPASGCGSVSGNGTSATYTAPTVIASSCTATIKVTAVGDATKTATVTATVNPIGVVISPNTPQMLKGGQPLALTGSISNDGTNSGLTWTVSPPSGCGTLSASTGVSVTYNAPASVASACVATITVASTADSSKTASVAATVNPISVAISPTSIQNVAVGGTQNLSATVTDDFANAGVNWSLTGCGSLSGSTTTATTYNAPSTLASSCTGTVTATSKSDNTKSASVQLPVAPISVTLSPVGPLTFGEGASQNIQATVANDGLNKGVTWSLAGGCGTLSGSTATAVTYNAPTALASTCTPTLTATSTADNSRTASVQITVNPITIAVSPNAPQNLFAGQTLPLSATLTNDGANRGASWSVNPASGCGSVAAGTGNTATYTAPTVLASQCVVTVTATSVTDNTKSAPVTITVSPAIVVTFSPATSQTLWADGSTLLITPTVSNDTGNKGVNLTLNPPTTCGTLSASNNVASGTSVTYTPPATLSNSCSVTVTATSISDGAKVAMLNITVNPIVSVSLSPNSAQFVNAGNTLPIAATVIHDIGNKGVTWSSTGCGSLSGSTTTGTNYNAPAVLASACTATVTATSIADNTKSATLNITADPAVAVMLSPNTQQFIDAGHTLQITPTVTNDGANKGVNVTLNPPTGCGSLSASTGVSSGTAVTYTAPPTLSNPCSVTFTATSVTDNTKSAWISISANPALILPPPNPSSLGPATTGGNYNGFINASGGIGPYTWTVTGLSNGLTSNASANTGNTLSVSGTPTPAGTVTFQVSVTDKTGATAGPTTYSVVVTDPTPLAIQTPINLPTALVGQSYNNGFINVQGGIPGYTWSANPTVGSLPAGLSLTNLNGSTLQITGTPQAPTGNFTFTVKVTDSANHTATAQATIVVANASPLSITTAQDEISNGLRGAPYGAWINASGGSGNYGNYVFSIVNGVGTGLPPGLSFSLTNFGSITGTPTTAGTYTFQVKVTDSSTSQTATSPTYTVVISNGPDGSANHWLYGQYAFLFRGFVDNPNSNGGNNALFQSASIGSFFADGAGNITGGTAEVNDGNGFNNKVPFSGTYSIGADHRGIIHLCVKTNGSACQAWITSNLGNPNGQENVFAFSLGQIENVSLSTGSCPTSGATNTSCPVYTDGNWTSLDDVGATPSGAHGDGQLFRQDTTRFASTATFQTSIAGRWAFGFVGEDSSYNNLAAAGIFSADNITNLGGAVSSGTGITDINDNQTVSNSLSVSGSYNTAKLTASNGRFGSVIMTVTSAPTGYPANYVGYMVNQNRLLFLSNDAHTSNSNGLVSGIAYKQQQSSYTSMPSKFVMYMSGSGGGGSSDAFLGQVTCAGTACTINASDENSGGTYKSNEIAGTQFTSVVTANGRVTLTGAGSETPTFYLYDSSATGGGVMLNAGSVQLGNIRAQGPVPASISAMAASYYMGSLFTMDANGGGDIGTFTTDASGNMNGSSDSGGQGNMSYGGSISGMTLTLPNIYGVFNLQAGGKTQVACYAINPVCSGGGTVCGSSTPYAMNACIDAGSNNPKLTIVQQVK